MGMFETLCLSIGGLACLILILILVQLSRFLVKLEQSRQDLDASIIGTSSQLKNMQTTIAEILIEQKRITRLTVEGLDLKKAEMTGDFEIIEEPLPGSPASGAAPVPGTPPITGQKKQGVPTFPELKK